MKKNEIIKVSAILFLSLILRLIFVFAIHPPEKYLYSDMAGYYERAAKLALGVKEKIYEAFYPPGTHYIYSIFFHLPTPFLGIKIFNVLASVLSCYLVYLSTKILFSKKAAFLAIVFASINYLFIDFTGYILSETPFILSLCLMFYFLIKSITKSDIMGKKVYSFVSGLAIIISASIKPIILLFIPFYGIWWLFNFKRYQLASNLPFYICGFFPFFILLCLRMFVLTGYFGTISSNAGLNFYQGRSRVRTVYCHDIKRNVYSLFASPVAIQKNYSFDQYFYAGCYDSNFFFKEGLKIAQKNIPKTLLYSLENIYDLFYTTIIWPTSNIGGILPVVINYSNIALVILVILPAMALFWIRFKSIVNSLQIIVYFPIFVILISSAIFQGDPRYRVPFDIFFIILASHFYSLIDVKK